MKAALVLGTQQFERHPSFDDPDITAAYGDFLDAHEERLTGNPRLALPLAQMRKRRVD